MRSFALSSTARIFKSKGSCYFRPVLRFSSTLLAGKAPVNHAGIQLLEASFRDRVFGGVEDAVSDPVVDNLSIEHLTKQGIYGKQRNEETKPLTFDPPELMGSSIGEHFYNIGLDAAEPYLSMAKELARSSLPPIPLEWSQISGWTRYGVDGKVSHVAYPADPLLVFDVEVLVQIGHHPVLACAASPQAWYSWTSPGLAQALGGEAVNTWDHLIPLNECDHSIVVAHNASYDRGRVAGEYRLRATNTGFIDTMSLHVAVGGLSSIQRLKWIKYQKALMRNDEACIAKEEETSGFFDVSSTNNLAAVAQLYCGVKLDKELRNIFITGEVKDVVQDFNQLMTYCAKDVDATHKVYCRVLPQYFDKCPHPASFAGILQMGKGFLPTNECWPSYIDSAESLHQQMLTDIESKLESLAEQALLCPDPMADPWLARLDWTLVPLRMTKPRFLANGQYAKGGEPRPYAKQLLPGKPMWYRNLYNSTTKRIHATIRSRIAPYLLKLKWMGFPIFHSKHHAWTYHVPMDDEFNQNIPAIDFPTDPSDPLYEEFPATSNRRFYRIPHKDGEESRCGNPLAKNYVAALEAGTLSSEYPLARQALEMNAMCAYWISARDRVKSQFVVWQRESELGLPSRGVDSKEGVILPQIATMGTVTRRAVEATWMTASNAKKSRIGSELKAMIRAPAGYKIVGADVDSEELWISSLIGDAQFRHHGASAFGWMTLQGSKSDGTDMHSRTASILGISRGNAKIFNYGRIYGAGIGFAVQLLMQFNPSLSQEQAKERATELYRSTKGQQDRRMRFADRSYWYGGSESFMFNRLEEIANSDDPRTPVLGCAIPNALLPSAVSGGYLTSRINWVVQSSGVDYLHLLLVAMDHLIRKFHIDARFMISVHDEVRYLSAEHDAHRTAMALQVANLWTRSLFAYRLGFSSLPQSVAFFSAVDIDWVLRKEVDLSCVTPSHPTPLAPGSCLTIDQLLELPSHRLKPTSTTNSTLYHHRPASSPQSGPYPEHLVTPNSEQTIDLDFLRAQNASNSRELSKLFRNKQDSTSPPESPPPIRPAPTSVKPQAPPTLAWNSMTNRLRRQPN
ncbi:DNA-directed DNA polymerase gamma mip1 [Entomophthora muscae]|uniref:DNA-directed DNA polymerase gamma mip1 n=1 Tax=Entomophthora muscae TaxID=34485 RepID=A0ACC2RNK3_9FUNG|nr:DNA-directed DNA polymerase gamma mip1 [Entomophthora muscae]